MILWLSCRSELIYDAGDACDCHLDVGGGLLMSKAETEG